VTESSVALPPVSVETHLPHYTSAIPTIEWSPVAPDNKPVLVCRSCGDTMQHLRTIPKLGTRLEQFIFVCPSCGEVSTKEVKRSLWRDILKIRREQIARPVKINRARLHTTARTTQRALPDIQ
jgi:predicted metal-binding protein